MVRFTNEWLNEWNRKQAGAGNKGLHSNDSKPAQGHTLELRTPGKAKGSISPFGRFRITFIVYSQRPCDWDGYDVKALQDMLVHAGFIYSDDWASLEGSCISRKAISKQEEKTVIVIEQIK